VSPCGRWASAIYARRRQGQPARRLCARDRSARRLYARWHALERCGKRRTVVAVAVARELAAHWHGARNHVGLPD
jgi:hypothetical protein